MVFLLDVSPDIGEQNFHKLKTAVKEFIKSSNIESGATRLGIVTHSSRVYIKIHLNDFSTKHSLIKAVDEIPYIRGNRSTTDGIEDVMREIFSSQFGDRIYVPNVAIVITDDISNKTFRVGTETEISREERNSTLLYVVGVGVKLTGELNRRSGEKIKIFLIDNYDDLLKRLGVIQDSICSNFGNVLCLNVHV